MTISVENNTFYQTLFSDEESNVYAVLDGASVPDIIQNLAKYKAESICLYRGELEPELAQTAPYLVYLTADSELTDWVLSGIGHHWGIFAISKANIKDMRKHFRTFLMVYDPDGEPIYFRYYDPRVLRVFLPTCDDEEMEQVFGPVDNYFLESEDGTSLMSFTEDASDLLTTKRSNMLTIRKEQMDVLSQYMLNQFSDRMELHLTKRYSEQTKKMNDGQLRELIVKGVEEAEEYDVTDENDVKRFLEYHVEYGRDFGYSSETKWAKQILNNKDLTGTSKMNEVDDYDLFVLTLGK